VFVVSSKRGLVLGMNSRGPLGNKQVAPPSCRRHSGECSGASRLVDGHR
jgi:hypothetical protein